MLCAFSRNNLKGTNDLKRLFQVRAICKKAFSDRNNSSQLLRPDKLESKRQNCFLLNPYLCSRFNIFNISNCYYSNGAVRHKSNRIDKESEQNKIKYDCLKPATISKDDILKILNEFYIRPETIQSAKAFHLDGSYLHKSFTSFRRHCVEQVQLPAGLVDTLQEVQNNPEKIDEIFPHFLAFSESQFPHVGMIEELEKFSDLTEPANWYPVARSKQRKVIYHAGPTNSGKTYHALQRFLGAKSGVYCGPLRLLAAENFKKANEKGVPCDLVTGEERKYANEAGEPSLHQACTVEMTSVDTHYEVAVIDEIQMVRDSKRGWAWTRAVLGVAADEIHVCGEESGVELLEKLCENTGDEFEVRRYQRLTSLTILDEPLDNFDNIKPGDCIICFNKNDIFHVCKELESRNIDSAVIYGTLPPATKIAQAERFNDPADPCKVLVATDAVGMGLNLSIKRVIFYSITKPSPNKDEPFEFIPPFAALQIAGRAGRFNTQFEGGEVTTFDGEDLPKLKELLNTPIPQIQAAGLAPTLDQIMQYKLRLPEMTLTDVVDLFTKLCKTGDSPFFMCDVETLKFLADLLEDVPMKLEEKYAFCCAPISGKQDVTCSVFVKFARQFNKGIPMTLDWVCSLVGWPMQPPSNIKDLIHLEEIHDIFDLYHWLSFRFPEKFPDTDQLASIQDKLELLIRDGVQDIITKLKEADHVDSSHIDSSHIDSSHVDSSHESSTNDVLDLPTSEGDDQSNPSQDAIVNPAILSDDTQTFKPKSKLALSFLKAQFKKVEQEKRNTDALEKLDLTSGEKLSKVLIDQGIITRRIWELLKQEFLKDKCSTISPMKEKAKKKKY